MNPNKVIIKFEQVCDQANESIRRLVGFVKAKYLIDLIEAADLNANPRSAKVGNVTEDIIESIKKTRDIVPFKTKGILLAVSTPPKDLDQLARQELLRQLEQQRSQDRARGRIQAIEAEVRSVAIQERSPRRIALQADLAYTDLTRDGSGRVIERTPPTSLRNVYVFGRDGETWRLAATRSAR